MRWKGVKVSLKKLHSWKTPIWKESWAHKISEKRCQWLACEISREYIWLAVLLRSFNRDDIQYFSSHIFQMAKQTPKSKHIRFEMSQHPGAWRGCVVACRGGIAGSPAYPFTLYLNDFDCDYLLVPSYYIDYIYIDDITLSWLYLQT